MTLRHRSFRSVVLASMLACAPAVIGCAVPADASHQGASTDAITEVDQSGVKRQSIGNCWIYATASWAESLHKTAGGEELNISESYWTYWHWFDQIANGTARTAISTGGTFGTAAEIINRYGWALEADFIPAEAEAEMSRRQEKAEQTINASLTSGALSTAAARGDRALVRRELNNAFAIEEAAVGALDGTFGADVSQTLDRGAPAQGIVHAAADLSIKVHDANQSQDVAATLQDAVGTRSGRGRAGDLAWNEIGYPRSDQARRDFQKRFQRALADHVPVILSWFVDFNAMQSGGKFVAPPATPGRQGGHMVVMSDYQINDVPNFGTLLAGTTETRTEALEAALDSSATIEFIRIKNSWGTVRLDRDFKTGYHDLYMTYLNGPAKRCSVDADDNPDLSNCRNVTPFTSVVLPPGY